MTVQEARTLAQQSPVTTLTTRLGELKEEADRKTRDLTRTLTELDKTKDLLAKEHGIAMTVDLGPIGNAAAHARVAALADKGRDVFEFPRAS